MQTLEKALHQPLPFTSSGQTFSDRITAAKHSLAGSQLGKKVCKATTEELGPPKEKHLEYLLHCTNEPNASIPAMANLLLERTQQQSWTIVYKALITIHYTLCYGNERFMQYLISCNTTLRINSFIDKTGHDMALQGHRYAKYINEKLSSYQLFGVDFTRVKRGREDGMLRTMHIEQLTIMMPVLQSQIDTLLDFTILPTELSNGIIKCSFILLFRDLIRLFACYNDGIINLLEKFFDMDVAQCKEALNTYKNFLGRLDRVGEFLKLAEVVGMEEIPDLTRAPASLLDALESHLVQLSGAHTPQIIRNQNMSGDMAVANQEQRQYLENQKKMFDQFEREKKKKEDEQNSIDLLLGETQSSGIASGSRSNLDDLLDIFSAPPTARTTTPRPSISEPLLQFTPTIRWEPVPPAPSMPMPQMGQTRPQSTMLGAASAFYVPPPPGLIPMGHRQQFGQYENNMPTLIPYNMLPQAPSMHYPQ